MKKRIILVAILISAAFCQAADKVSSIINKSGSGKARPDFSICFVNVEDGKLVYEYNSHKLLKPASNAKLLSSAAALHYLGGDFEYITRYGIIGDDLVIIGSGDPIAGDPVVAQRLGIDIYATFDKVLQALQAKGITEIKGDLLVDNFIFDDDRFHKSWPLDQSNRWYQAQISGLSFNDNCVDIVFKPAAVGAPAIYELIPDTGYLQITNNCKTANSGTTTVGATRVYDTNEVTLIGKCYKPLAEPINVTVDRPAAFHGYVLVEYLLKHGIKVNGSLVISRVLTQDWQVPAEFQELYQEKHTLVEVVNEGNRRSLNMVAESVFKTVAAYTVEGKATELPQRSGSWPDAIKEVTTFLTGIGLPQSEFIIDDGCGLSHNNRISAAAMCKLLVYMTETEEFDNFRNSLSTPEIGTLAKKGRFGKLEGRIFAKTGYITGANTLSGYCLDSNDKWIAFSVLTNSPAASNSIIDSIVNEVVK